MSKKYILRSPGNIIGLNMFIDDLKGLRQSEWSFEKWEPRAALIDKAGNKHLYTTQKYNSKDFKLVQGGWTHDHCEMCIDTINSENSEGYTDGYLWLCQDCYGKFISPETIEDILSNYKIVER